MKDDEIIQIRVAGQRTGIIGLHSVLESVAAEFEGRPDVEITEALMERLGRRNYMAEKARDKYASAFLREFKKYLGQPVEASISGPVQVRVLGPGCPNCERLEQEVMQVMAEMRIAAELEHVRDPMEIGAYGMISVPALVVDETVVVAGRVPGKNEVKAWLQAVADQRNPQ
jgi:small redox-active disulfide protein 2